MITDPAVRQLVADEWKTVVSLQNMTRGRINVGLSMAQMPDAFLNLPLVLAYAALEEALDQCLVEGLFSARGSTKLGAKMHASRPSVAWIDFDLVNEGRDKRNDLAHESKICPGADCRRYIGAIGAELLGWGLV